LLSRRPVNVGTRGDARLEKHENDLRPRLREKDPWCAAPKRTLERSVRFSLSFFGSVHEARAPKPLHAGRRPARMCAAEGRRSRVEGLASGLENIVRRRDGRDRGHANADGRRPPAASSSQGAGRRGGLQPRTLRDRLTGRTPRSERGDRGSSPCPGSDRHVGE
jgi:hypothetical protein